MKKMRKRKVMKNYRIKPDLVSGIAQLSDQMNCTNTYVLELAIQKLISAKGIQI